MNDFINIAKERITKAFESEEYDNEKNRITNYINEKSIALTDEINKIAAQLGFR